MKRSAFKEIITFFFISVAVCVPLSSEPRNALLIANGAYEYYSSLRTPVQEGRELKKTLEKLGFTVTLIENASREKMIDTLVDFGYLLEKGGIGFFHYGGHAVQVDGKNYLIPVNADIPDERRVSSRGVAVDEVMKNMQADTNIVVLDACRNNPLPAAVGRTAARGLALVMQKPKNSIIVYSADAGRVAHDGVFTPILTRRLLEEKELIAILRDVRREVSQQTNGEQNPKSDDGLMDEVYLAGYASPAAVQGQKSAAANNDEKAKEEVARLIDESISKDTAASVSGGFVVPPQLSVKTAPQDFSPDGDGKNDELNIQLTYADAVAVKRWAFQVNDPNGNPFWSMSGESSVPKSINWNGRGNNGELVQSAMHYPYTFTVSNALGATGTVTGMIETGILVIPVGDALRIVVPSLIFRSDHADFKTESAPGKRDGITKEQAAHNERVLNQVVQVLNKYKKYRVTIVGHANRMTDDEREETEDNPRLWGSALIPLSKQRAEFVKAYLIRNKVKAERLSADGKGGREPVVSPKDAKNRWKNRRIEFILTK